MADTQQQGNEPKKQQKPQGAPKGAKDGGAPKGAKESNAPKVKISDRASTFFFPSACSGDMYEVVPTIVPSCVEKPSPL